VAINVALYGPKRRWAMTERGRTRLHRSATLFAVGESALSWDGDGLSICIEERCAPWPHPLSGRIRVYPTAVSQHAFPLSPDAGHVWRPIAPTARVEVAMTSPEIKWSGGGYFDANAGVEPLEKGFTHWVWSRAPVGSSTVIVYEAALRRAGRSDMALRIDKTGAIEPLDLGGFKASSLPGGIWGLNPHTRIARTDPGSTARRLEVWEDTPFYTRSKIAARLCGTDAIGVHEGLDLDRFANPLVRVMLTARMPRTP
jgi:carotenoid 1,2-hydratase